METGCFSWSQRKKRKELDELAFHQGLGLGLGSGSNLSVPHEETDVVVRDGVCTSN